MEVTFHDIPSLCALMPRPQIVQGLLVSWLQNHFSAAPNIEAPSLANTLWAADVADAGIVVDSVFRWRPDATEYRPAVLIKRGAWRVLRLGIDDRKMPTPKSGNRQYITFLQGSHTLFCLSNKPAECEILGAEVYRELIEFGPVFREAFNFHKFQVMEVGEVSILEESQQNFVVPISIAYAVEEKWEVFKQAPPLKKILMSNFLP